MSGKTVFFGTLGCLLILLAGILTGLYRTGTDDEQYIEIERGIAQYDYIGLTQQETEQALSSLAAYLRGELDSLDNTPFNADEKAHMVDVKNLFVLCRGACIICWIAGVLLMLLAGACARRRPVASLLIGLLLSWTLVAAGAAAFLLVGFDRLFIQFHHLFFTNDLWLMDPRTDVMIRMLPQTFFEQMAARIVRPHGWLAGQVICLLPALGFYRVAQRRRSAKND